MVNLGLSLVWQTDTYALWPASGFSLEECWRLSKICLVLHPQDPWAAWHQIHNFGLHPRLKLKEGFREFIASQISSLLASVTMSLHKHQSQNPQL